MAIDYDVVSWALITGAPSPATSGTSFTVTTGSGARFLSGAQYTKAVLYQESDPGINERVAITNRSTDTFTIIRNLDARGAQTVLSSGWALRIDHDLVAWDPPKTALYVNLNNTAALTALFAPTTHPANSLRAGDQLRHHAVYLFINQTAGAINFTLNYYFGYSGGSAAIFYTKTISVPANTTYQVDAKITLINNTLATQTITGVYQYYNVTTGALVTTEMSVSNDTYNTGSTQFQILSYGQMASASTSLFIQGIQAYTELVRGA